MADQIERLAANILRQARTAGAGTRGLASSVGASARAATVATPSYVVGDDGRAIRRFIPGRDPLYDPTVYDDDNPPPYFYILGAS